VGGVESDYSVCPCLFLQFLQFCQFMLVRLRQVTSGYIRLHQVTSDYVSLRWRDGMWSSTTGFRGRGMNNRLGTIQGQDKGKT
jgi:hypothetical protein